MIKIKKVLKRVLLCVVCLIFIMGALFGIYVSDYYRADAQATAYLEDTRLITEKDYSELPSDGSDTGFIFYPGGKVEYTAYLPLMEKLEEKGFSCFLVKMPFNLAFFGSNRADEIIAAHPEIDKWYIGGHSLGGAFASDYASKHQEKIEGLVLLGAYLYGDYPMEKTITIYGSEDQVLNRDKINYTENVFVIEGGNHADFGNYGEQKGDGTANITVDEQQQQAVKLIMDKLLQS